MSAFLLTLLPNDRAILSTERELTPAEIHQLNSVWKHWQENGGIAIVTDCRVRQIDSIELDLRLDESTVPAVP